MQRWSFMVIIDTRKKDMHFVRGAMVAEDLVA